MTVHSKFEKWNNLPEEMKLECIKWLDLKTRYCLRGTSQTERRLVNSQKFHIYRMSIDIDSVEEKFELDIQMNESGKYVEDYWKFFDRDQVFSSAIPLFKFIFQTAKVWEFHNDVNELSALSRPDELSPFHITKFCGTLTPRSISFIGKCAKNSLKHIYLSYYSSVFPTKKFLKFDSINSIKSWELKLSNSSDLGIKIARKWMELDVDIKSRLQFTYYGNDKINVFANAFAKFKVIDKSDTLIRIETKNQGKHMILKFTKDEVMMRFGRYCECVLTVVPFDLEKSEYEKIKFY